jgi:hypothetical protein
MPRKMLDSNEMNSIIEKHLFGNKEWEKKDVPVPVSDALTMNVTYFYNKNKNFVIIPSPIAVKEGAGDAVEPSYHATVCAIKEQMKEEEKNFGIGCSLLGKGTGERHYTALFKEKGANGKMTMFDSKISAPTQFFNSSESPGFFEKSWGFIKAPFKTFGLWAFGAGKEVKYSFLGNNVTIHRLATQPFFDGVSCGFHSSGAVLKILDLIEKDSGTAKITSSITSDKQLDLKAEKILNKTPEMNSSLSSLILEKHKSSNGSPEEGLGFNGDKKDMEQKKDIFSDVEDDNLEETSSQKSQSRDAVHHTNGYTG